MSYVMLRLIFIMSKGLSCLVFDCPGFVVSSVCLSRVSYVNIQSLFCGTLLILDGVASTSLIMELIVVPAVWRCIRRKRAKIPRRRLYC